jgi:histidinol dehydrogenase|tara:strand:- start:411 stop:1682 length:1272 start_codon:yes stop_codon:yes gene_type:complete
VKVVNKKWIFDNLNSSVNTNSTVSLTVKKIIQDIKKNKDVALLKYVKKFENKKANLKSIIIPKKTLKNAYNSLSNESKKSLRLAYKRIFYYHSKQKKTSYSFKDQLDSKFYIEWKPIENVGLYIPGGLASYPSTVLMTAIPAKIAEVPNIMICVPSQNGQTSKLTLAAAYLCGVNVVYNVGGAQAIAALAFGTKIIKKADKVFGPGNQYVAEAKKQLFGVIGIDLPAGPSEVLVIANNNSNPTWIAYDVLAQGEHDPNAKTYVLSKSKNILIKVKNELKRIMEETKFKNVDQSIKNNCNLILAKSQKEIYEISNFIAPEHLHIHEKFNKNILKNIKNAGSVFLGEKSPVALGDYTIGTNHVLPTDQTAKFSSGLGVEDYTKKTVFIDPRKKTLKKIANHTINLARQEGLEAHALSVEIRKIKP